MKLNTILSEIPTNGKNIQETYLKEIKRLPSEHEKYLLITDDKSYSAEYRHKFIELLPLIKVNKQLILHPSKFQLLAWQGLINVYDYDIIIINCQIKLDLIHAFRVFYIDNIAYDCKKPSCSLFVENYKDELSIYFQSIINNEQTNSGKTNINCYTIKQDIPEDLITYAKCKRVLKISSGQSDNASFKKLFNTLEEMENENIDNAIELLKKCINPDKVKQISANEEDKEFCRKFVVYTNKLDIVKKYAKTGKVCIYGNVDLNLENVCNIENLNDANLQNSTLILWEDLKEDTLPKCKKAVFFKLGNSYPELFINEISKIDRLDKFIDYTFKRDMEYYTVESGCYPTPTLSWEHSVLFLEHINYQILRLFHENYLYIRKLLVDRTYHSENNGQRFYSYLKFPKLIDNDVFYDTYKSDAFTQKKDTLKDVSYKFIIRLVETGFLDKNFIPVKTKFIDENKLYLENIKKVYEIDCEDVNEAVEIIRNIKEDYEESDKFKRDYAFDSTQESRPILDMEEVLRKQPDALKDFSNTMSVYIFNNGNVGIATNKSFTETTTYKNIEVAFLQEITFTDYQKAIILNYQVIFFGVNFKRVTLCQTNLRKYAYFVLPMKNRQIDFEYMDMIHKNFFIGSVISIKDRNILNNFLLFNPITRIFYEYVEETDKKLTDLTDQKLKFRNKSENSTVERTFNEYFNLLYGLNLNTFVEDNNAVFEAMPYSAKKDRPVEYHAGEVLHVTKIKKSIKSDYRRFIEYFNIFETLALAYEFKCKMQFSVSLINLATSFTQKSILDGNCDLGYERFEFIGDSVLKYSVSKFLFTECGYNLNKLVSTKDSLICNNHLYKIGRNIDIQKYFSFNKYSENLFQPPAILDEIKEKSLLNSLDVKKVFLNNNQYTFVKNYSMRQTCDTDLDKGKKVYADIVESLIGVHYVEEGFDNAWNFIKNIGILENHGNKNNMKNGDEVYLMCDYEGVFPFNNIEAVENIINYTFTNKGYLEKAMIHPSYKNNIFGSERFQKLELVGDCFLDLKVSDYIYFKYTDADPEGLHTHRKKLVNNHTFAVILFKTGLFDLALTGLSENTRDINSKISKCYSDIFESLAGAVVLDCGFDMNKMEGFFKKALEFMSEYTHDC